MFFDEKMETLDRPSMEAIQLERLQRTVKRVYERVPMYRERLDAAGVKPEDIQTLRDLQRIPFTDKADLRDHYPFGMFAVPKKDIVRIHASSGTTGKPTVVGYTRNDMNTWTDCVARLATAVGVTAEDTVQISFGYGLFTGAFGLHQAMEKIGCAVIPMSSGNTEKQIMIMRDFGTTVLVATPSYAIYLGETCRKMGLDPKKDLKLRVGLFGGEATSLKMRKELEDSLGILATDNYGMSELIGPGVSGEGVYQCGMHISEDHFIPEIIDPATGEVLPAGSWGELVVTTITKEALPVLRYRTHDITRLIYEPCQCGRTTVRMEKLRGRSDDMLIIRGVNVFPGQIDTVLSRVSEVGPHYEITVTRDGPLDKMELKVELIDGSVLESFSQLESVQKKVRATLRSVLGLDADVKIVEPQTLQRFEGKAKRIKDLRHI